ncbi:hypothetical protein ACQPWY_24675 [Pseudonocardia xinjiangensis]|uniref:COG1470 family protein n=1 Tax=Pseudonocardia xinjiangensis TaxID=75289 RepID=UPI003D9126C3
MSLWTSLEPTSSTVTPGAGAATFTLKVRNNGDTVEEYQLSVLGPLSRFCQFTPDKLRLFPGDEGTVTLTVKVPRTPEVLAGPTPIGVRVVPREHPELSDVAEGTVTVTSFGDLRAEMNPVTVRGRAALQRQQPGQRSTGDPAGRPR